MVIKNEKGILCRWDITDELETMYEVVCERDKSFITHVAKDKCVLCATEENIGDAIVRFENTGMGYYGRTIDISNRNGKFGFTSLGMCISLEC
jgi:hypothetical protein